MSGTSLDSQVAVVVAATVFAIMFRLGLAIPARDLRRVWQPAGPMLRGLVAVLVVVLLLALAIARALELPRPAEIGIVLMAISPSAPVALRRSLGAGSDRAFAPSLQICAARSKGAVFALFPESGLSSVDRVLLAKKRPAVRDDPEFAKTVNFIRAREAATAQRSCACGRKPLKCEIPRWPAPRRVRSVWCWR